MTRPDLGEPDVRALVVELAPASVDALARRVAELLAPEESPKQPPRLLTAAEVSRWWGVDRAWVYAHADELGARRLGSGERPRLRFDPNEVADRLGQRPNTPKPPSDGR